MEKKGGGTHGKLKPRFEARRKRLYSRKKDRRCIKEGGEKEKLTGGTSVMRRRVERENVPSSRDKKRNKKILKKRGGKRKNEKRPCEEGYISFGRRGLQRLDAWEKKKKKSCENGQSHWSQA